MKSLKEQCSIEYWLELYAEEMKKMKMKTTYYCRSCKKGFDKPLRDGVCFDCWFKQTGPAIPVSKPKSIGTRIVDILLVPIGWLVRLFR